MLNYKSVRSSEPQIRSQPALRQVGAKSDVGKRMPSILAPYPLPFPTFQNLKDASQSALQQFTYYAWHRPAHLRSSWLVLADGLPLTMVYQKDTTKLSTLRIPFDQTRLQQCGPIVLEGAWDAQDQILWIWDVVVWEKQMVWSMLPFSKRWELVRRVTCEILQCTHTACDAEVRVPAWQTLGSIRGLKDLDPAMAVEFQPEKAGQRRILYRIQSNSVAYAPQSHAERKMLADGGPKMARPDYSKKAAREERQERQERQEKQQKPSFVLDEDSPVEEKPTEAPKNTVVQMLFAEEKQEKPQQRKAPVQHEEKSAILRKDTLSKLPDTYRLTDAEGTDMGLAAIRSLGMSKELREVFKTTESVNVKVRWYEPFQKYEVRQIDS